MPLPRPLPLSLASSPTKLPLSTRHTDTHSSSHRLIHLQRMKVLPLHLFTELTPSYLLKSQFKHHSLKEMYQ